MSLWIDPEEIKLINDYVDNIKQNGTGQGLKKRGIRWIESYL